MGRKRYDAHDAVGDTLKFITSSKVRTKIMLGLQEEPKTSSVLRDEIGASASSVIHAARDLEKEELLVEKSDGYHLTTVGAIVAAKLEDAISTMAVLEANKEFWLTHQVTAIPDPFLNRLHVLADAEIITSKPTNVFKAFSHYLELVRDARELRGVSPIMHPRFPPLINKLVNKGVDVQLVLTEEIFEDSKEEYPALFEELIDEPNLGIWVTDEPVKVAFTVTDTCLSLGLFSTEGEYDSTSDLVSRDKGAINWGRELFNYYKTRARRITPGG